MICSSYEIGINKTTLTNMEFENAGHSSSILNGLNDLRLSKQLCDVVLNASGESFPAHKNVLIASSPFFAVMFNGSFPESNQHEISLKNTSSEVLEVILSYIYTGYVKITQENVEGLLEASCYLQIEWIQEKCCKFLKAVLEPNNCIGIKNFADDHSLVDLKIKAMQFIVGHFAKVIGCDEFVNVKFEDLTEILTNEEIFLHKEDALFSAIIKWVKYSPETRILKLPELFKHIHPLLISKDLVKENQDFIEMNTSCYEWISRATDEADVSEWNIFILDKIGKSSEFFRYGLKQKQLISLPLLPEKAFAISFVGYNNTLFVQGGAIDRISSSNSYYYNIYREKWSPFGELKLARSHHRSVVLDNSIYALGGNGLAGPMSSVERLDFYSGQSVTLESMLSDRTSMGAVVYENCIYVMGGENRIHCLHSLERYDPREGVWTELQSMIHVNSYCSSAIVTDSIYCSEGLGNSMEKYDFRANQWEMIQFDNDREFYELFSISDELYCISGTGVDRYSSIMNDWLNVFDFPIVHDWDTSVPLLMQNL